MLGAVVCFPLYNVVFDRRSGAQRFNLQVLRVADASASGTSGESGPSIASGQRGQRNQDFAVRPGHVPSGLVQHMPVAFPGHVHIRYIRNVVLHERETPRRPGRRLQLPYVRPIDDPSIHGKRTVVIMIIAAVRSVC